MARLFGLVVGIDAYPEEVGPLRGCVGDARAFEGLLRLRAADAYDDITIATLTDGRATRAAVIDAFRSTFADAGSEDVAVFFYAGHGAQEPAPPEHRMDESDDLNETLVMIDSRSAGGYDLADKELALLVHEVSGRGTHVLVVLDCCHAGSGVRDPGDGTAVRRTDPRTAPRPPSAYLDGVLDPSAPYRRARYVLLGACRSDETAKEVRASGARRGAFTLALEAVLNTSPGRLTYALLHRAVVTSVRGVVAEQTPVLECPATADAYRLFLGGASVQAVPLITAGHEGRDWTLHAGVLHGLPAVAVDGARTRVTLHELADTALTEATAITGATVGAVRSTSADLEIDPHGGPLDLQRTYRAVIRALPTAAVRVRVDDVPQRDALVAVLVASAGLAVAGAGDDTVDLRLVVEFGRLRLVRPGASRPLVAARPAPTRGGTWDPSVLDAVAAEVVHVGRWLGLWRRNNPTTRIGPDDVVLDLLETDDTPAPVVDGAVRVHHGRDPRATHELRIRVRNRSGRRLHVAVLALSDHYGVQSLLPGGGEWLDHGQERYVPAEDGGYDVHFSVEPGRRTATDLIKVIASTEGFDASAVQQDDLTPPDERDRLRGSGGRAVRTGPPRVHPDSADDWTTREVLVVTVRDSEENYERAWQLAEEFDTAARTPGGTPDHELLDDLTDLLVDDVLGALIDAFGGLCHGDEFDRAEGYAQHLIALARRMEPGGDRGLLAAVDVHTAQLCRSRGDLARAAELARRCGPDLTEFHPALLADREWVLGGLAEADGRTDDARGHAEAARTRFLEFERWGEAAAASEAVTGLHPTLTAEALEDWRLTAELGVRADCPDEARRCVEQACLLLFQRLEQAQPAMSSELESLCATAGALAAEHGLAEIAARLGLAAAALSAESDLPWPEVVRRHEEAAAELVALTSTPAEAAVERARVDASLGRAAMAHQRIADARRLLTGAAAVLREAGSTAQADVLDPLITLLDAATGAPVAAARGQDGAVADPAMRAALLMSEATELLARGETYRALERVQEAITLGPPLTPAHDLVMEGLRAAARPQDSTGADVLARIEDELAAPGARPRSATAALTQVARLLRTGRPAPAAVGSAGDVPADIPAALAGIDAMPATDPGRADRAAALIRAIVAGNPTGPPGDLRPLDRLLEIVGSTPPADRDWPRLRTAARILAFQRAMAEGELTDVATARARLAEVEGEAAAHPELTPLVGAARSIVEILSATTQGGSPGPSGLVSVMKAHLASLPEGTSVPPWTAALVEAMDALAAAFDRGADPAPDLARLRTAVTQLPDGHLRATFEEALARLSLVAGAGGAEPGRRLTDKEFAHLTVPGATSDAVDPDVLVQRLTSVFVAMQGGHESDPGRVDAAVDLARDAVDTVPPDHPQRVFTLLTLAMTLSRRFELTTRTGDLQEAFTVLQTARTLAGGPSHPHWPLLNDMLAEIGRRLGDRPDGHLSALEGLHGHVWQVLIAPGHAAATRAARDAGSAAVGAARTCLRHNDPAAALTALDAGRGLALFAAAGERSITDWLTGLGEHELAERWRTAVTAGADQLPGQLRRDVLSTLHERNAMANLLDPPTLGEIGQSLTELDADALVYLVPGDGPMPGFAVIGSATGRASFLSLPNLQPAQHPDVEAYLTALHRRSTRAVGNRPYLVAAEQEKGAELRSSLDALCSWAWHAAMGPVIEGYLARLPAPASRRPHRVVLVPMGDLARIPWQAARRPDGVHAVELIGISQAASARMLNRSAVLPPVAPPVTGLFVADPDTKAGTPELPVENLRSARWEAMAVRHAHYLGARYLGRRIDGSTSPSGAGTAEEVEQWLRDPDPAAGSLLHLACHGVVESGVGQGAATAPTAYLMLADRQRLTAEELIGLLGRQPERDIALVVLAACHTGTSLSGHDEAYSLGTAFLAGGVRSVLSTHWAVDDLASAALMFMFHHHLRTEDLPVWEALRQAQLWMLDRNRTLPPEMPPKLRRQLDGDALDALAAWAGFVHWGR